MHFRKNNKLGTFDAIRCTGNQINTLGLVLKKKHDTRLDDQIEIIPWNYEFNLPITNTLDPIYNEIEERIKFQILVALDKVNNSLNTHFCVTKIYYDPSHDIDMIGIYELLTISLIRHYFEKNELDQFT